MYIIGSHFMEFHTVTKGTGSHIYNNLQSSSHMFRRKQQDARSSIEYVTIYKENVQTVKHVCNYLEKRL